MRGLVAVGETGSVTITVSVPSAGPPLVSSVTVTRGTRFDHHSGVAAVTMVSVTICIFPNTTAVAVSLIELLLSSTRFISTRVVAERKCFHVGAVDILVVEFAVETDVTCHDDESGVGVYPGVPTPVAASANTATAVRPSTWSWMVTLVALMTPTASSGTPPVGGGLYSDEGEFDRATHDVVPSQRRCVVFIPRAGPHRELCWEIGLPGRRLLPGSLCSHGATSCPSPPGPC